LNCINDIKNLLKLDQAIEDEFLHELSTHIEDKCLELKEKGIPEEEAKKKALESLGSAKLIAKQIYEVYSQGTWKQAIFAALPHLLIAALFTLHLMPDLIWSIVLCSLALITVIYGWCRGKPTWLFPWLGCLLLPAIFTGIMLIYLPNGWTWAISAIYIPLAIVVLVLVVKQTLKRDWLFISLMLLPIPIVLGWLLSLSLSDKLMDSEHVYQAGTLIGLSFAILALSVVVFVRVKQRWLKTWVLIIPEVLILAIVALYSSESISFLGWLLLSGLALILILGPAMLERSSRYVNWNHRYRSINSKP
jgi:hypothetical protein